MLNNYPLALGLTKMLKGTRLLHLLALAVNRLLNDPILTVKILGPMLYAFLGLRMYVFARKTLGWSPRKSFLLVLICSIYFVSLRISWEMYRQMLGTIFLFLSLTAYHTSRSKVLPLTAVLSVLMALSHEIAAVILLMMLLADGVRCSLRGDLEKLPFAFLSLLPMSILIAYMFYDPTTGFIRFPIETYDESCQC